MRAKVMEALADFLADQAQSDFNICMCVYNATITRLDTDMLQFVQSMLGSGLSQTILVLNRMNELSEGAQVEA